MKIARIAAVAIGAGLITAAVYREWGIVVLTMYALLILACTEAVAFLGRR